LEFSIKYPSAPHIGAKPYEVVGLPQIQLNGPSIDRYVPSAVAFPPRTFRIHFPLQLTQFQCLRTFSPGQAARILFTVTNNSNLDLGGTVRPAQIRMLPGPGEFDVTQIVFNFEGREQNLAKPFIYDLPDIKAKETIVIDAQIKIPADVGFLLKAQFITQIYLTDPRN